MNNADSHLGGGVHDIPRNPCLEANSEADAQKRATRTDLRILTVMELFELPTQEPLIGDVLSKGSFATLSAKWGNGKTFLALDMGCSIASGEVWFGKPVCEGLVLYIAAEGVQGFGKRIQARIGLRFGDDHPIVKRLRVLPQTVNFLDAAGIDRLLEAIKQLPEMPVLIVIDTLARSIVGAEENSAKDMGMFVRACDRLREETGATVLVLHHFGKNEAGGERGSSALGGAADTMLEIAEENGALKLTCKKQKDGARFDPLYFRLEPVTVDIQEGGKPVTSCRVKQIDEPAATAPQQQPESVEEDASSKIIRVLRERFGPNGATGTELREATGLIKQTLHDHRAKLIAAGTVEVMPGSTPKRYRLVSARGQSGSESGETPYPDSDPVPKSESESASPPRGAADSDSVWTGTEPVPGLFEGESGQGGYEDD